MIVELEGEFTTDKEEEEEAEATKFEGREQRGEDMVVGATTLSVGEEREVGGEDKNEEEEGDVCSMLEEREEIEASEWSCEVSGAVEGWETE